MGGLLRRQWSPEQADNGTEFHGYERAERLTGASSYFERPYHSWERGSGESANGLLRQYPPEGSSMSGLTQQQCNAIARKLNERPRKRLGFRTPLECFDES
jgi:IS30 family transposase